VLLQGELGRIAPVLRGALGKLEHWVSWGERTLTRCQETQGIEFPRIGEEKVQIAILSADIS